MARAHRRPRAQSARMGAAASPRRDQLRDLSVAFPAIRRLQAADGQRCERSPAGAYRALPPARARRVDRARSEEHTSELQSLMRISYAVFCLKKKKSSK